MRLLSNFYISLTKKQFSWICFFLSDFSKKKREINDTISNSFCTFASIMVIIN